MAKKWHWVGIFWFGEKCESFGVYGWILEKSEVFLFGIDWIVGLVIEEVSWYFFSTGVCCFLLSKGLRFILGSHGCCPWRRSKDTCKASEALAHSPGPRRGLRPLTALAGPLWAAR